MCRIEIQNYHPEGMELEGLTVKSPAQCQAREVLNKYSESG